MIKKQQLLAFGAAMMLAVLTACGGDKEPAPTAYAVNDDSLPSLSEIVPLGEDFQWSVEEDEEGVCTYTYEALESSGAETVQAYTEDLRNNHQCTLLTEDGSARADDSVLSAETGTVVAAMESATADGLFQLSLTWDETSCSVTPTFQEGAKIPAEEASSMTLEEAVDYLRSFSPATLGLSGSDMSDYDIFSQDGLVFLNDQPCLCLNVYRLTDHQYQATYLLAGSNNEIYRLDRETGQVYSLNP